MIACSLRSAACDATAHRDQTTRKYSRALIMAPAQTRRKSCLPSRGKARLFWTCIGAVVACIRGATCTQGAVSKYESVCTELLCSSVQLRCYESDVPSALDGHVARQFALDETKRSLSPLGILTVLQTSFPQIPQLIKLVPLFLRQCD